MYKITPADHMSAAALKSSWLPLLTSISGAEQYASWKDHSYFFIRYKLSIYRKMYPILTLVNEF